MADLNYIAAGRINTTPLDLNGNLDKILKQCAQAVKEGISIIAFPELAISGYNCGDLFWHSELTKGAQHALLNLKYSLPEGIVVGVGLPLTGSDNKSYDAYVLLKKSKRYLF